jgi:hypothetical protein
LDKKLVEFSKVKGFGLPLMSSELGLLAPLFGLVACQMSLVLHSSFLIIR